MSDTTNSSTDEPPQGPTATSREPLIHDRYLPFTKDQLRARFATVARENDPDRHLAYYLASVARAVAYTEAATGPAVSPAEAARAERHGRQIEKDERFWIVTALLSLYHASEPVAALASLLRLTFGAEPPIDLPSWEVALGDQPDIYFEVNVPSPPTYSAWLATHGDQRNLIPYLRERAAGKKRLEGTTKVDAVLIAPSTGFAVFFEAKVLADVSTGIEFDATRNQLARTLDCSLYADTTLKPPLSLRRPERTCVALVTPELFRSNPETRLYGWLLPSYQRDSEVLRKHLPHRSERELTGIGKRLGWIAWEDFNTVVPDACQWLASP